VEASLPLDLNHGKPQRPNISGKPPMTRDGMPVDEVLALCVGN
jgi:hypothetical protein